MTVTRLMDDLRSLLRMSRPFYALIAELGPLCIGKRAEARISGYLEWTGFSCPDRVRTEH